MAFFCIPNIDIKGLSVCVPRRVEKLEDYEFFSKPEVERMLPFFGLKSHHIVDESTCASDLCLRAANKLIQELKIERDTIDLLVFVTTAPDYIFPATACVLHERLGLRQECVAFDVPFGCSGWVYAMTIVGQMLSGGTIKRALLLAGDTTSRAANYKDKSVYPFLGDAGTATIIDYNDGAYGLRAELGTIGSSYDRIIMPDGGFRNRVNTQSLQEIEEQPGVLRRKIDTHMEGMDVFSLSTKQDPLTIKTLLQKSCIDIEKVDCFAFHQTNKFLMDRVVKKLMIPSSKVPYSFEEYANTSCAAIPLTLCTQRGRQLRETKVNIVACALGVGLSYGAIYFETEHIAVPDVVYC